MAKGRMINKDISRSKRIASLSGAARELFYSLIPFFDNYGKMNGSPYFIKGEVVPLVDSFDIPTIEKCLREISEKTNVKWFEINGLQYIHSVNFFEHQEIRKDRLGSDTLPSYSGDSNINCGSNADKPRHEVEDQDQVQVEDQGEVEEETTTPTPSREDAGSSSRFVKQIFTVKHNGETYTELDWINRVFHQRKKLKPGAFNLAEIRQLYGDLNKTYERWFANPPPRRMAAFLYTMLKSEAEDELRYARRAIESNAWGAEEYRDYLAQCEEWVKNNDYEVEY